VVGGRFGFANRHPERTREGSRFVHEGFDAVSEIEILREYAQDDGYFSLIAGVAKPRDDSG
jgi:hypothetical protein